MISRDNSENQTEEYAQDESIAPNQSLDHDDKHTASADHLSVGAPHPDDKDPTQE